MGKYKITNGQNLYDVAMHIYGSIEGITDLLICNPELSMATSLRDGQELIYTDDLLIDANVAAYFRTNGITPANGERNIYYKEPTGIRVIEIRVAAKNTSVEFAASGDGVMEIDWGDNTPLEYIPLSTSKSNYYHCFDNSISSQRKIRFYGDFRWKLVDITALNPSSVFFLSPIYTEQFRLTGGDAPLDFMPLLNGTYRIDLSGMKTGDLMPLVECRIAMEINLSGINTPQQTLDRYLTALVREHYGRRSCRIILSEYPSGEYREPVRDEELNYVISSGMEAVWLLTHEPSWNEAGPWEFVIAGQSFKYEQ